MCIFCEIIKGNIPSKKVYEDDNVLSILDISQTTKGHTLVIPKKHFDNILEADKDTLEKVMSKTQDIAKMLVTNLGAAGCNILVNTGEAAGQTVNHLHVHIIPRYDNEDSINIEFKENKFDLDEVLNEIKVVKFNI